MRRICALLVLLAMVAVFSGCAAMYSSPVKPPVGMVYSNFTSTQDDDFSKTQLGKSGEATVENVLGIAAWGDCSAQAAAKNGGIKTINHTDYRFYNVLGVYSKYTTIVYGE